MSQKSSLVRLPKHPRPGRDCDARGRRKHGACLCSANAQAEKPVSGGR